MEDENVIKVDKSRWLIIALAFLICWLLFRKLVKNAIYGLWKRLDALLLNHFARKYNDRMHSRKTALLFNGLRQMTKDAGRPLHILEIGAGTGVNFAYYPDGTTVSCLEPVSQFTDKLMKKASQFPGIQFGELHSGFAEDMATIESGSIDAVVSTLVLCCVNNIDKCLQEIVRVLRPVGIKQCVNDIFKSYCQYQYDTF